MQDTIEIPYREADMFSPQTRIALERLAKPDLKEHCAPWGLMVEMSGREHVSPHGRQVRLNMTTQVYGFGFDQTDGLEGIFRTRGAAERWHGVLGSAYLRLLEDLTLDRFVNDLPKCHPSIAPEGSPVAGRDIEILFFPGAMAVIWGAGISRWDDGLAAARKSLKENLLLFIDAGTSAHRRLEAVSLLRRAVSTFLTHGPVEGEIVQCAPLAELRVSLAGVS